MNDLNILELGQISAELQLTTLKLMKLMEANKVKITAGELNILNTVCNKLSDSGDLVSKIVHIMTLKKAEQ